MEYGVIKTVEIRVMTEEQNFYVVGMIVSYFAILLTNYLTYKKITIEDIILSILACLFSWSTAILVPILIAVDDAKFLDKSIIK